MIIRIWKGTTTPENSKRYEQLLRQTVFPKIAQRNVVGYHGIQLLKNAKDNSVDFITIMAFENLAAVKRFAGEDHEQSYVIDEAKALLESYDLRATHYELLHNSISIR